jgi:hypothetical protein
MDSRGTLVKEISMGDVEDPYLYAAFPIAEWEKTEEAEYIKQHVPDGELVFYCDSDPNTWGFRIRIYAPLTGPALTYYNLKYLGIQS